MNPRSAFEVFLVFTGTGKPVPSKVFFVLVFYMVWFAGEPLTKITKLYTKFHYIQLYKAALFAGGLVRVGCFIRVVKAYLYRGIGAQWFSIPRLVDKAYGGLLRPSREDKNNVASANLNYPLMTSNRALP